MSDHKERVKKAIEGYYEKQDKLGELPTRKNEKPEQEVVNKILVWLKQNDFDAMTIEAKATYSVQRGGYSGRAASPGTPDIIGNFKDGLAIWIEAKAPSRRSTVRDLQIQFLTRKIQSCCFAVVVDSVDLLEQTWRQFITLPSERRIEFLLDQLPKKREPDEQLKLDQSPGTLFDAGDDDTGLPW